MFGQNSCVETSERSVNGSYCLPRAPTEPLTVGNAGGACVGNGCYIIIIQNANRGHKEMSTTQYKAAQDIELYSRTTTVTTPLVEQLDGGCEQKCSKLTLAIYVDARYG